MEKADCLILAAGASRRMGAWKLLLPFHGKTIIETTVHAAREACSRVILVVGYRAEELEKRFRTEPRVVIVRNMNWELGMFSSIRSGIPHIATERFFISLGDMPLVPAEVYRALLDFPPADVVFPVFQGIRGHPVLFRQKVKSTILSEDPATGVMKNVACRFSFSEMPWGEDCILRDADSPGDYSRL